jgi:hypothetical protein
MLFSVPALAADTGDQTEEQTPPKMKLGGADTRAPGPLTVPPADIQLPPIGQPPTEDLQFDYHGYFRVPLAMSIGKRQGTTPQGVTLPTADQSGTTFHIPAVVPDYPVGTWLNNNNIPAPWATALFSYGNKTVTGTVGIAAFNFTASQDSAMTNNSASVSLGPVYLHFNLPKIAGSRFDLDWDVGAFGNRYGSAGKFDSGKYGMFLFGATGAIGETLGIETDAGPMRVRLEHGIGGNYYVDSKYASTLLHHAHLFGGYKQMAKVGLHYLTAWTADERNPPVQSFQADGRVSVIGGDVRFNGGAFGELYFGAAVAKAIHALHVSPVLYTMNALGGPGMRDNYFGCKRADGLCSITTDPTQTDDVNGTVTSILFQYDYSFGALARYLSRYPRAYWADGPDLVLSLFGTMSSIKSDNVDASNAMGVLTHRGTDGTKKSKFGGELTYSPIPWLSVAGRFDRVMPWSNDTDQNFSVFSPKIMLKTSFFSHEVVTIQYSRYFYGGKYPRLAGCGSKFDPVCGAAGDQLPANSGSAQPGTTILDQYGHTLDPSQSNQSYYDKEVIYMSAAMWW